ncbi:MAG: acyl-CoA dehydratase activase [Peptococcaceae bacterium]|jgi:predicted CoA-substrate-specific enzyme activase|nr:acyl-CoA dehydratase activase [Peptococcaceae bacterium]
MKTAGIDVGFDTIKVAVMDGEKVLAKSSGISGCIGRAAAIDKLYGEALVGAGLKADDIEKVVATGIGKYDVKFAADHITDAIAEAKAARYFFPDAASVVDIGADQTRVVAMDGDRFNEVTLNQKCMAGLGLILDVMADRLGFSLDEVSKFEAGADKGTFVNDGCPVFAELDSLEALNDGVPKDQIMGAVINTVVVRLNSILHDKVMPAKDATVLLGGVSRNAAVINGLKARSGVNFIVPDDALYGSAIGCALIAAN